MCKYLHNMSEEMRTLTSMFGKTRKETKISTFKSIQA